MPRADDWEHRLFVFECAWLLSMGASVDEIAQVTGRSRPTVYRALDQARQWRWLSDSPRLTMPPGEERDELEQHIADSFKADQVRDSFGSNERPSEVIVAPAPPADPEEPLVAAVCHAIRRAASYQPTLRASREAGEAADLRPLIDEVAADEGVRRTGGNGRDVVERLVRQYLRRPHTDRELERSRRVGRATAARYCRALAEGHVRSVGVSWGYHVRDFVRAVSIPFPAYGTRAASADSLSENAQKLLLFPLIGSLGLDPGADIRGHLAGSGAYANCMSLAAALGAEAPVVLTQPAYIPEPFHDPEGVRQVWRYVQEDISIRLIFGHGLADRRVNEEGQPVPDPAEAFLRGEELAEAPDGYLGGADALVTGIGTCEADSRAPRLGLLSAVELARVADAGAVGDCSGSFFWDPMAPPSPANCEHIRTVNSRVIGPRLADFIRATVRAKQEGNGSLGTMVLASGEAKASALARLCRWRAANIIVIDSDLADCLLAGGW
jgi:DNA-binding transcriptional regulator LsrR (DeoR family)